MVPSFSVSKSTHCSWHHTLYPKLERSWSGTSCYCFWILFTSYQNSNCESIYTLLKQNGLIGQRLNTKRVFRRWSHICSSEKFFSTQNLCCGNATLAKVLTVAGRKAEYVSFPEAKASATTFRPHPFSVGIVAPNAWIWSHTDWHDVIELCNLIGAHCTDRLKQTPSRKGCGHETSCHWRDSYYSLNQKFCQVETFLSWQFESSHFESWYSGSWHFESWHFGKFTF